LLARCGRLATRVALAAALLLLVITGGLIFVRSAYADRVYPGIYVDQVKVGGNDVVEARSLLQARVDSLEQGTVSFTYGGNTWAPSLADVGVTIDIDQSLQRAYAIGREDNPRDRLLSVGGLLRSDQRFPLVVQFDQKVLNGWLDGIDEELGLPPHDAYLTIEGAKVKLVPEVDGTITDRTSIQQLVFSAAQSLVPVDTELPTIARVSHIRTADLKPVETRVNQMLSKPVEVTFKKKSWTLQPEVLGTYLTQTVDPEKTGVDALTIGVDDAALGKYLSQELTSEVNRDPTDAKVTWDAEQGKVVATKASKDGYKLKPRTLAGLVAASLLGDHTSVEAPVTVVKPDVDSNNLDALGITTELGTGDSSYEGSNPERATNVQVGSSLLNSTLVAPGEEFSFNHAIGVIEEDRGFVEAGVIDGERIGRDVGGGICQVSTTVYRAALKAGMPITEWWPHTYRLAFYELDGWEPGIDASILQPEGDPFGGGDFKFRNPTDSWMLVESYTENDRVYVVLYGAELDYTVTLTKPTLSAPIKNKDDDIETVDEKLDPGTVEQTEFEEDGVKVSFDRTVEDRDGNVILQDTWDTTFESRPNVYKVSPDMKGKSPAGKKNSSSDS